MKLKVSFLTILTSVIIILSVGGSVFAQDDVSVAKSLIRHGMKMYENGYYDIAVSDFSRSLLLRPNNPDIIEKLIAIGAKDEVVGLQRFKLYHFEDLVKNIKENQELIGYYQQQNDVVARKLSEQGVYDSGFKQSVDLIQLNIQKKREDIFEEIESEYSQEDDPLELLNSSLQTKNSTLLNELAALKEQNDLLRRKQAKLNVSHRDYVKHRSSKWSYAQNYHMNRQRISSEDHELGYSQKKIVPEPVSNVVEYKQTVDQQKEDKDQVVAALLETSEKELIVQKLNQEILELESRVELGQKIVSQKDDQIEQLQASVARFEVEIKLYKDELDQVILSNARDLSETNELLRLTTERLEEATQTIERIDSQYEKLTKKFNRLENKSVKKFSKRKKKATPVTAMRNIGNTLRLTNIKNKLFGDEEKSKLKASNYELQKKLTSKDEKLLELNGIIQIYKAELFDTDNSLKERQNDIVFLEEELNKKEAVIQQAKNDIVDLKTRLLKVEGQLEQLSQKESLTLHKKTFNKEVSILQSKLKDVNQYLIDSLNAFEPINKKAID